jgi:dihydroorotate dehydrogenase
MANHAKATSVGSSALELPDGLFDEPTLMSNLTSLVKEKGEGLLRIYESRIQSPIRVEGVKALLRTVTEDEQPVGRDDLAVAAELLYYSDSQREAAALGIKLPLYSTFANYRVNGVQPWTVSSGTDTWAAQAKWRLLGRPIGFPIGVPASALTGSSDWVGLLSNSNYNVITFKTVRSRKVDAYEAPNWIFVESSDPISVESATARDENASIRGVRDGWSYKTDPESVSTANSFGVPSSSPEQWQEEVKLSSKRLTASQILIVSVMGGLYDGSQGATLLADDYAYTAKLAYEAGARYIELNLSCPNSLADNKLIAPPVCSDQILTQRIVETVRAKLPLDARIVAKLSYMPYDELNQLVGKIGHCVDAFAGINTVQSKVLNEQGENAFPGRDLAGVSGRIIHDLAVDFVTSLSQIRAHSSKRFDIIGMGGVTSPETFWALREAGADAVQSASGVFVDQLLGQKIIDRFAKTMASSPPVSDPLVRTAVEDSVKNALQKMGESDIFTLSAIIPSSTEQINEVLKVLVKKNEVRQTALHDHTARFELVK